MSNIHDRFKDVREDKTSARDFFRALKSGTKASGMGYRVYNRADEGSAGRMDGAHIEQRENWRGQLGERPQYDARPAPGQLPTVSNMSDVQNALGAQQQYDPGYAVAVLQAYVVGQMELGRSEKDIVPDLDELQRRLPQYIDAFRYVRDMYRLDGNAPPSYAPPSYQ